MKISIAFKPNTMNSSTETAPKFFLQSCKVSRVTVSWVSQVSRVMGYQGYPGYPGYLVTLVTRVTTVQGCPGCYNPGNLCTPFSWSVSGKL